MSDTTTPNYGFTLPSIGASQDTWGNKLNANWTEADSVIYSLASGYLPISGGVLSGNLSISPPSGYAFLDLNKPAGTTACANQIGGTTAGTARWLMHLGTAEAESGTNAGSNLGIYRYDDLGNYLGNPLSISRATGNVAIAQALSVGGVLSALSLSVGGGATVGGTLNVPGSRIVSSGANNNPAIAIWNTSVSWAGGWFVQAAGALQFGPCDGSGNPLAVWGYLSSTSWGFNTATVSITVNNGANTMCYGDATDFNVPGQAWKPGGGVWASASDARIKTVLGDYASGLDAILALRPVRYTLKGNWRPHGDDDPARRSAMAPGTTFVGLVAQEAETAMPEMIGRIDAVVDGAAVSDLRTLDMTALPLALVNAVKQLAARVAALEAQPRA
jgi:hypothetical protein